MLSNKHTAAEVEKMMRQCSDVLDQSVRRVMDACPEEEFKAYRRVVGQIMGTIYLDVLRPIHQRYPDLEPEKMRRR